MYIVISGPKSLKNDKKTLKEIEKAISRGIDCEQIGAVELKTRYQILVFTKSWYSKSQKLRDSLDDIKNIKYYETYSEPKAFWSEEKKKKRAVYQERERKRKEENKTKQEVTAKVLVRQTIELYKRKDGRVFFMLFKNKRLRKAFQFASYGGKYEWRRSSWPGLNRVEACSPLEFTIQTGTSFTKSVREEFGLEVLDEQENTTSA